MKKITVVTLGFGDPDLLNRKTIRFLLESNHLILRTGNHPISSWLLEKKVSYDTLDNLYDQADNFDDLNQTIALTLQHESGKGPVTYAVTDASTDSSVQCLYDLQDPQLEIVKIPGISLYDQYQGLYEDSLSDSVLETVPASVLLSTGYFDPVHSLLITEIDNAGGRQKPLRRL